MAKTHYNAMNILVYITGLGAAPVLIEIYIALSLGLEAHLAVYTRAICKSIVIFYSKVLCLICFANSP